MWDCLLACMRVTGWVGGPTSAEGRDDVVFVCWGVCSSSF